jgi:ubiquinone/menaquinone biosynthesis C-methylase UbiE
MSFIEPEETNKFNFEPFAAHAFYTELNRSFVRRALASLANRPADAALTIVDMACGTGAVTRLIAQEMARQGRSVHLVGVDPSVDALRRAQKGMEEIKVQTSFIQGEVADLPKLVHDVDVAFFCNAIHLLPDKLSAFRLMAGILARGGIFACSSSFFDGAYVQGTERFYRMWTRRAVGWLHKEHPEVRLSREGKAIAMQWLNPDEYTSLLKQSGFDHVETAQKTVLMPLDAFRDLGQYWLFIEGALPGVPLALGAKALETSVFEVGRELDLSEVPRNWLQIIAFKM